MKNTLPRCTGIRSSVRRAGLLTGLMCLTLLLCAAVPADHPPAGKAPAGKAAAAKDIAPQPPTIHETTTEFTIQGKTIPVERFAPKARGQYPAILMLHACTGLRTFGWIYREEARVLARDGYAVFLVHYLECTDDGNGVDANNIAAAPQKYRAWRDTVRGALDHMLKQPDVHRARVGVFGVSLGAYLALELGTTHSDRIHAVANWFGGLRPELHGLVKKMPRVLIIHDKDDQTVSVREAHALEETLKARKLPCESKIYDKQGHVFVNYPLGEDCADAKQRTRDFFARYVKQR